MQGVAGRQELVNPLHPVHPAEARAVFAVASDVHHGAVTSPSLILSGFAAEKGILYKTLERHYRLVDRFMPSRGRRHCVTREGGTTQWVKVPTWQEPDP